MIKIRKLLIFFLGLLILTTEASAENRFFNLLPAISSGNTCPADPNSVDPNSVNSISSDQGSISGQVIIKEKFDGGSVTLSENYLNEARMPKTRVVSVIQLASNGIFTFSNLPAGNYVVEPNYSNSSNGPITYNPSSGYYYFVIVDKYSWSRKVILSKGQNAKLTFPADQAKYDTFNQYVYSSNYYSENPYSPYNTNSPATPTYNYTPYSPYTATTPNYTPYTTPATNYTPYTTPATQYTPYTANTPPYSPYTTPATNYTPYENSATPYSPFNYLNNK